MDRVSDELVVFNALKQLLFPYSEHLVITIDEEGSYSLDTYHVMENTKHLFFGAVQVRKRYVSYHLMPVYVNPALLVSISEPLRKRMHGKSCFNFTAVEPDLVSELAVLTASGYDYYVDEAYILAGPGKE